jgi:hypothetical protein
VKQRKARYQQGSISKEKRAHGFVWKARYSEYKDGKRWPRTQIFDAAEYPDEEAVRKAIQLTVAQINEGAAGVKTDTKLGTLTEPYHKEHLPTLQHSTNVLHPYLLGRDIEPAFSSAAGCLSASRSENCMSSCRSTERTPNELAAP